MSFFNLEVLEGKPTKSMKIMPHLKLSKNMDLLKYDQNSTIQKSLAMKRLKFSKKRFFI
jgi:hypothetical protein